jgi:hypothetical protein
LAISVPRSFPADLGRETLNPIEGFETTSMNYRVRIKNRT